RGVVISAVFPVAGQESKGSVAAAEVKLASATSPDQQRLVRALFRRMKAWCGSHGAKLAVVNNGWQQYDWLPKLLASENITTFDAAPMVQSVIARDPASYVIPGDGHPNAKGAAVTAEAIWPFIETLINEVSSRLRPAAQH